MQISQTYTFDYYPFGMLMPGRSYSSTAYKYGFNGKEKDDEVKGSGNSLDFGARLYDSRLGRWLSLDPLQSKYPDLSPYNFCANNPILFIDPDGKENTVYLVALPGMSRAQMRKIRNQVNKNFKELGLKTEAVLYVGNDFSKDFTKMDPTDAVVYVGNAKEVVKEVKKVASAFSGQLEKDPVFGPDKNKMTIEVCNPEISENPHASDGGGNKIIAVNVEDATNQIKELNASFEEGIAWNIVHGAGHNAGLDHNGDKAYGDKKGRVIPSGSVMTDGALAKRYFNQGKNPIVKEYTKLSDLFNKKDNGGVVKEFYEKRFGTNDAKPAKGISVETQTKN